MDAIFREIKIDMDEVNEVIMDGWNQLKAHLVFFRPSLNHLQAFSMIMDFHLKKKTDGIFINVDCFKLKYEQVTRLVVLNCVPPEIFRCAPDFHKI